MTDDTRLRGGQDRHCIDIHEPYELRDWSRRFGVSPEELKEAVAAVGDSADKVAEHLSQERHGASSQAH